MFELLFPFFLLVLFLLTLIIIWRIKARKYISSGTVASAYDAWTKDKLLEMLSKLHDDDCSVQDELDDDFETPGEPDE